VHGGHHRRGVAVYGKRPRGQGRWSRDYGLDSIRDAYMQAFLAARHAAAAKPVVTLKIVENNWLWPPRSCKSRSPPWWATCWKTPIDAARLSDTATREVEGELLQDGSTLHVTVVGTAAGGRRRARVFVRSIHRGHDDQTGTWDTGRRWYWLALWQISPLPRWRSLAGTAPARTGSQRQARSSSRTGCQGVMVGGGAMATQT